MLGITLWARPAVIGTNRNCIIRGGLKKISGIFYYHKTNAVWYRYSGTCQMVFMLDHDESQEGPTLP